MTALFVASIEALSGKTAVCAALGLHLASSGLKVGYLKPLSLQPEGNKPDSDIACMKQVLNLEETANFINPISITTEGLSSLQTTTAQTSIKDAYAKAAQNKDVVLVEGSDNLSIGSTAGLAVADLAKLLDAKVLLVVRFKSDTVADEVVSASSLIGDRLLGTVINAIPAGLLAHVESVVVPMIESKGIRVLATIEESRTLLSTTVGDLVESLDGKVITRPDKMGVEVENLMVGAMSIDSALEYFSRKSNKAVIVGGDRPDIQLAALETSTACMVLTGGMRPNPLIEDRSTEQGVPVIIVQPDTMTTVKAVEEIFGKTHFKGQAKLATMRDALGDRFNWDLLKDALGSDKRA